MLHPQFFINRIPEDAEIALIPDQDRVSGILAIPFIFNPVVSPHFIQFNGKTGIICAPLIYEFERYHYEKDGAGDTIDGRFAKEFDHFCDPVRYILTAQLGKARFVISHDTLAADMESPLRTEDGAYYRAPSFTELARENSIPLTLQEAKPFNRDGEEDENDPGGMLWSF